jgi:DNA-binding SARP family transcriptional activator
MQEARTGPLSLVQEADDVSQPALRVYLLGQFCVERREGGEWQVVANRTWQRRRARALLGCLLSQAGRRMGREQMMEALWPDLDIDTAANRLNGAVHELRQILEPGIERPAASRMLRLERDILILADASHIWVDAEAFESLLNKANTTRDAAQVEYMLEEAAALYGGDYLLEELYSEWAAARRESLRRGWMGLLLELAELRAARNALTSAIEPLDRLLTADPTHETAVRRLMVLLTQLDRRGEAIRAYQRLAAILKKDYENDPLPETMELYRALRQGQIQATRPVTGPLPASLSTPEQQDQETRSQSAARGQSAAESTALLSTLARPTLALGRPNQSPLIGRERELEAMEQILLSLDTQETRPSSRAISGAEMPTRASAAPQARFVVLMGETGIGKTRLAEEISHKAQARGWLVAWTRAYEQEGAIPYRPWTDILRTLLQDIPLEQLLQLLDGKTGTSAGGGGDSLTPPTAQVKLARLASLLPELATHSDLLLPSHRLQTTASPEQERFHLWEAMLSLLSVLSQPAPLLIVLDDLHWTDDSSLELLAYLARHRQNERVMLLATCRDIELAPSAGLRVLLNDLKREQVLMTLPVQPLTREQIALLIAHLPRELVRSIQSQAGGNPLFAEELARFSDLPAGEAGRENGYLHAGGRDDGLVGAARSTVLPETIAAVLERRLARLSSECQTLLSKAAVLGGSFEFSLLVRVTSEGRIDEDTTLDLLEEALRSGLLSEEVSAGRIVYHFWHPLIVSHLYERLSAARRAQLHRRTAQALIDLHSNNPEEVAADIVYHLSKYGQEKEQLAYYAELAGSKAMSLSAYSEALHNFRQALDAWQALNALAHAPRHIAHLLECMAECNGVQGNFSEARQQLMQALELYTSHPVESSQFASPEELRAWQQEEAQVQGMIWHDMGHTWIAVGGDHTQIQECVRQGEQALEAAGVTDGVARACLEHLYGGMYWAEGNFVEARRHVEVALAMHEASISKLQDTPVRVPGTYSQTPSPLPLARSRRALREDPQALGRARESLGVICISMGLHSEALQHLYASLEIYEKHDRVSEMCQVCSNIASAHINRGEYETAREHLQRSLKLIERTGHLPSKVLVMGNLGEVARHTGKLEEAATWLRECLQLAEQLSDRERIVYALGMLASALQDLGETEEVLHNIRRSLVLGYQMQSNVRVSISLVTLAEWRIRQALVLRNAELAAGQTTDERVWQRYLRAAQRAAERALAMDNTEAETRLMAELALATIHALLAEQEQAYQQALTVLEEARQSEVVHLISRSQMLLGQIQTARDLEAEAAAYFEEALQTATVYGRELEYAQTLLRYGASLLQRCQSLRQAHGKQEDALLNASLSQRGLDYLREARDIFAACKARTELQWTERLLTYPERPALYL